MTPLYTALSCHLHHPAALTSACALLSAARFAAIGASPPDAVYVGIPDLRHTG
jgi:hypothetical protein